MDIALIGSKDIGLAARDALQPSTVITVDDQTDTRSRLADYDNAIVVRSRAEANKAIASLDAELVVVAGWYWIIAAELLRERPFVGIHHSLLPAYRGGSPLVWALLNGETVVGTSLFTLTDQVDAGPIWAQAPVEVGDGYIGDVQARCDAAAVALLPHLLDEPVEQDTTGASWCAQRRPDDGEVDWRLPAEQVVRWIRAQSHPYPGAFTHDAARKVTIWRASVDPRIHDGTPGQVVGDRVICGDRRAIVVEDSSHPLGSRLGGSSLPFREAVI